MKKFMFLGLALLALASCEKDPDLDKVQDQVVTYTQYDKKANFASAKSFYLPDSLLLIGNSEKATYLTNDTAAQIINAMVAQLTARGFTQVEKKADADLGVQMSYIESTYYFVDSPYWWNGYPGYWNPGYWGRYWNGWYYPYVNVFSYSNGSLLTDIIDLDSVIPTSSNNKLTVIWQAYSTGLLVGSTQHNINNAIAGIKQAFVQSPYLKSGK